MINYSDEYIDMLMREYARATIAGREGYDGFRAMLTKHEEEQAMMWETTCPGCRRLLDRLYEKDVVDGTLDTTGPVVLD